MILDYNLFQLFVAIMRHRNISRAASSLGIAQPSASNGLSRLRHHLGDELFVRSGRGMIPTPFAESIAAEIEAAIDTLKNIGDARAASQVSLCDINRRVRILATDFEQTLFMADIHKVFAKEAPNIKFEVSAYSRQRFQDDMTLNRVDLVFALLRNENSAVVSETLFEWDFVGVAVKNHPIVSKHISLQDYCGLDHLVIAPDKGTMRGLVDDALNKQELSRKVVMSVPQFLSGFNIVANSELVVAVPRLMKGLAEETFGLQCFELPVDLGKVTNSMHWHRRLNQDPELMLIRNRIKQIVQSKL
jgi:DNA-binding transcriptional LysR family regulator